MRLNSQGFCDHRIPLAIDKQALAAFDGVIFLTKNAVCRKTNASQVWQLPPI